MPWDWPFPWNVIAAVLIGAACALVVLAMVDRQ